MKLQRPILPKVPVISSAARRLVPIDAAVVFDQAMMSSAEAPKTARLLLICSLTSEAASTAFLPAATSAPPSATLAIVVASPALLDAPVATPEQLRAVNALCRYVEQAREVDVASVLG